MDTEFFKSKWNLLIVAAEAILVPIFGFVDIPSYAAAFLSSGADYSTLAKFVLAIVIALMLLPCYMFNKKVHKGFWAIITIVLLGTSLFIYFKYISFKQGKTLDYTSYGSGYIVKGDQLYPEKDTMFKEMEKQSGKRISETEFFAENHEINDSNGVLTAAQLWPKPQIEKNAKKIILLYLVTILLFSLSAVCAVQTVFCITKTE